jgi:hypothetical protein
VLQGRGRLAATFSFLVCNNKQSESRTSVLGSERSWFGWKADSKSRLVRLDQAAHLQLRQLRTLFSVGCISLGCVRSRAGFAHLVQHKAATQSGAHSGSQNRVAASSAFCLELSCIEVCYRASPITALVEHTAGAKHADARARPQRSGAGHLAALHRGAGVAPGLPEHAGEKGATLSLRITAFLFCDPAGLWAGRSGRHAHASETDGPQLPLTLQGHFMDF